MTNWLLKGLLTVSLGLTLAACNGTSGDNGSTPFNPGTDTDLSDLKLGHFDAANNFIQGEIGVSMAGELSAGGTLGLTLVVVGADNKAVNQALQISLSSDCALAGAASLASSVSTVSGIARTDYQDISCAGAHGSTDTITATLTDNTTALQATVSVDIAAEELEKLTFVSATPDKILIQGTGGQNNVSTSTLTFQVRGVLDNPLAQQQVDFSLNTSAGGVKVEPSSAMTNGDGTVSTRVIAGIAPAVVRVTASTQSAAGKSVSTQSNLLTINTGLADQNSFSIAKTVHNVEAALYQGATSQVTVRLSDLFNNPVADGTAVNFVTEGGQIEERCVTQNGACSVTWTGQHPIPTDHRVTILAYTDGHETLWDANSNNYFDDEDGSAISSVSNNGFGKDDNQNGTLTGFVDMSEAWLDANESGERDVGEWFDDHNGNGLFDLADGKFNGPHCQSDQYCDSQAQSISLRASALLIMSSSEAVLTLQQANGSQIAPNTDPNIADISLNAGEKREFIVEFLDTAGQVLANGTSINVTSESGTVENGTFSVPNTPFTNDASQLRFSLTNDGAPGLYWLTIRATAPSSTTQTQLLFRVEMRG
ncbi:hypothetical protein GCM10009092_43000 [Bowmanella denitrificans]|uniref:Big-1 domain-containing protein n=1 Tax=Bowmanella denitrificans TaxID=366582 RepID=A0ABN0XW24_9ALTE